MLSSALVAQDKGNSARILQELEQNFENSEVGEAGYPDA